MIGTRIRGPACRSSANPDTPCFMAAASGEQQRQQRGEWPPRTPPTAAGAVAPAPLTGRPAGPCPPVGRGRGKAPRRLRAARRASHAPCACPAAIQPRPGGLASRLARPRPFIRGHGPSPPPSFRGKRLRGSVPAPDAASTRRRPLALRARHPRANEEANSAGPGH